jgi:hypothetical protein
MGLSATVRAERAFEATPGPQQAGGGVGQLSDAVMFHSILSSFFTPARTPLAAALPGDVVMAEPGARGRHAQALAYAAKRRRAALEARRDARGGDSAYWMAGVTPALARAASIRAEFSFAPLP